MVPVSPDDRWVYYIHRTSDAVALWRIGIDGSDPKQLTKGINALLPVPSPDGRFVYITTGRGQVTLRTMKVPVDGGEPSQVSDALFRAFDISPDGNELIGIWLNLAEQRSECAILPTGGGALRLIGDIPRDSGSPCIFDRGGTAIAYVARRDGVANVFARPLSGGAERALTQFRADASPQIFPVAMSRDGRLALSRGIVTSDVVLIAGK